MFRFRTFIRTQSLRNHPKLLLDHYISKASSQPMVTIPILRTKAMSHVSRNYFSVYSCCWPTTQAGRLSAQASVLLSLPVNNTLEWLDLLSLCHSGICEFSPHLWKSIGKQGKTHSAVILISAHLWKVHHLYQQLWRVSGQGNLATEHC